MTCGGGNRTRSRTCTNPSPAHGGHACHGDPIQTTTCRNTPCPGLFKACWTVHSHLHRNQLRLILCRGLELNISQSFNFRSKKRDWNTNFHWGSCSCNVCNTIFRQNSFTDLKSYFCLSFTLERASFKNLFCFLISWRRMGRLVSVECPVFRDVWSGSQDQRQTLLQPSSSSRGSSVCRRCL